MKTLHNLISHLPVKQQNTEDNPGIHSLHMDSRTVESGGLFFCVRGYTVDGHDFAEEAAKKGAAAVITEEELNLDLVQVVVPDTKLAMAVISSVFYNHPTRSFRLIGVTGTNGKTTTTHFMEHIFQKTGQKTGMIGTMYTKIGYDIYDAGNTTPESLVLQQTFHQMAEAGINVCTMEVSSHALDLGRVRGSAFNTAVFTNLTAEHLDYHKTMEAYKQAKGLLFSQLGNTYDGEKQTAVLNADDEASEDYKKMTAAPVLTYGIEQPADIKAEQLVISPAGTSFQMQTPFGSADVYLPAAGRFSIYNALAAAAACLAEGVELQNIAGALSDMKSVPGRFEPVDAGQPFAVIVDYAHTPDSLENVLQTAAEMTAGKMYVVVGCGGDRDTAKRPEMGRIAATLADYAVFTSDNPRSEDPNVILEQMAEGAAGMDHVSIIPDRREAIEWVIKRADRGDAVIIAGKGHESYQVVGKDVLDFDDRLEAETAVHKWNRKGGR
ncbi:UDP-N-acetylmuramoyl-L-alanyl-D-glutamate--2,6-diaminopimelate ligase [Salibacterium halotolerans]|uniref:UDP-N-acetylmuramoyl-L-alanyl-D-glutamate--2,6-diaminopimelate ligase n=1 Tax=Salibacterium halotolerans TaxID=1884432 RepID=A0A1I5M4M2_9BACI|nr:UDP-N-acetylmuramoyl-L-alanyl-D-glutamate--2,6-diaminopimelate ligase [Salibacterium halotolerans]SFP04475.1 UDP-N-acetylmuramoyl-L-alanyl-D-glutamate--2,6-diaminopimelate ligase [Salibacterium halotolerans]